MAEAMLIAKRSGLDLVEFWHAIRMSAGNSFLWETCGPNVFRGEYHDSFPIDLMNKDTQLGYEMARKAEVRDPSEEVCILLPGAHGSVWADAADLQQSPAQPGP